MCFGGWFIIVLPTLYLVGGFNPSEKYYIVSWDYYSIYYGK